MTYALSTLPSGLRVATEHLPGMESATVAVTIDVGARFELEGEGGLSHMLEHMAFKGTKRRNAYQIAEEMDMVGGHMNAYTSLENTVYYARVLKNDIPLAIDILADILQHSVFDEEELARERQVILQEIAMHYDTPDDLILDYFSDTAYPDQPLGRSILGATERVATFSRDDLSNYIAKHYHTKNMVVSAAGNIDHEFFVKLVGDHFNALSTTTAAEAPKANYVGGDKRIKRKLEQLHVMLGFEGISFHDDAYYTWQILATILGGGMSSRLFQEVRERRGLAYTVQAFLSSYSDSGIFGIYAATGEDKGAEMLPVLCDEVTKLQNGINEAELTRAKNQLKASLLMSRENSASIAEWIGRHLLCYGKYRPAAEIAAKIDKIEVANLIQASKAVLTNKTITTTMLGPQKKLPKYTELQKRLAA
jgi:predicted Zn-dependent peptidase